MSAHFGRFVAYYRVSTDKQGQSGLGLDAQHQAVMNYLNGGPWPLVEEFTEVDALLEIDAFHRERLIPVRRGRSRHVAKQFHIRFCFSDTATADAFSNRFGGAIPQRRALTYVKEATPAAPHHRSRIRTALFQYCSDGSQLRERRRLQLHSSSIARLVPALTERAYALRENRDDAEAEASPTQSASATTA